MKAGSSYCLTLKLRNRTAEPCSFQLAASFGEDSALQIVHVPGEIPAGGDRKLELEIHAPRPAAGASELSIAETLELVLPQSRIALPVTATVLSAPVSL